MTVVSTVPSGPYQSEEEDFFVGSESSLRVGGGIFTLSLDCRSGTELFDELESMSK